MHHDQPEPTEEEQELVQERQQEEEAMRGPGHVDPERARDEGADAEEIQDA
jgi:3,4-dihydroxy-2-butanone 4-phosphate synthase